MINNSFSQTQLGFFYFKVDVHSDCSLFYYFSVTLVLSNSYHQLISHVEIADHQLLSF